MLGTKGFGSGVTSGAMGTFSAEELEWARFGHDWAHFGHDWAHFGVENLNYDYFGAKVPLNYFGAEAPAPPRETLADFVDRLKLGWAKLRGKKIKAAPLGSSS